MVFSPGIGKWEKSGLDRRILSKSQNQSKGWPTKWATGYISEGGMVYRKNKLFITATCGK